MGSLCLEMKLVGVISALLGLYVGAGEASCFGRDASWTKLGKPTVTQPSKNDPTKVMVSWGKILKNLKCVDAFYVHVIPEGLPKSAETKLTVDKSLVSKIVDVQPCVGYRFMVEFQENETPGGLYGTGETPVFKTTGTPTAPSIINKKLFKVGYQWDPVKQISNLRMVSISFPRDLIKYASCLDYIQVTGEEISSRKPSLSRQSSTASMTGALKWDHLDYNPQISAGTGAITLPARVSGGFSQQRSVSPPRGPLAGTYSPSLSSQKSSSSGYSSTSGASDSPFGPVEAPHYANTLPRQAKKGALKKSGPVKVQGPFLKPSIELLIAADANCAEYNFEVKFFVPKTGEIGKVNMIHLASLAAIPNYVPPPITAVMDIKFGASGKPVYGVKTSSGVSAACLPSYFEALDAFRQRLENEITYMSKKTSKSKSIASSTSLHMEEAQEAVLKKQGCICTSPHLELKSTDFATANGHKEFFGHYHYKGLHGAMPYYEKSGTSSKPITTTSTASSKPMFLFFDSKDKMWVFGPSLGNVEGVEFGSSKNNLAKCPGDPQATAGGWSRKSSILKRWKPEKSVKLVCATGL